MNSDMVFESLQSLANRWADLGESLKRLASSIVETGGPATFKKATAEELQLECSNENDPKGEAQTVKEALDELSKPAHNVEETAILLDFAQGVFDDSKGALNSLIERFEKEEAFGPAKESNDTIEASACRAALRDLLDFILQRLRDFFELESPGSFTDRLDRRGIRTSVDNLSTYPILTSEVQTGGGGGPPASPPVAGQMSLQRTVNNALQGVLGRLPKLTDTRSFMVALTQTFQPVAVDWRTEYHWTPRSYAGQTDLGGGVTGGQASLYVRAQVAEEKALDLLEGLFPLREDADEELVNAARSIVRTEIKQLVEELGTEGGPRVSRVDGLFDLLFKQPFDVEKGDPVAGHLNLLAHELGLTAEKVNTLEEEANLTNFIALSDYVASISSGWDSFSSKHLGKDLGTRFVLLSRALSVAAESVDEINEAMDSVFVGASERQVVSFRNIDGRRICVAELLSWVQDFCTEEAPHLVQDGGRRGAQTIIPTVTRLGGLVERFLQSLNSEADLPDGMRQPRVQHPVRELRGHLRRIERLATDVRKPAQAV